MPLGKCPTLQDPFPRWRSWWPSWSCHRCRWSDRRWDKWRRHGWWCDRRWDKLRSQKSLREKLPGHHSRHPWRTFVWKARKELKYPIPDLAPV